MTEILNKEFSRKSFIKGLAASSSGSASVPQPRTRRRRFRRRTASTRR
jgi:hypothetical protein